MAKVNKVTKLLDDFLMYLEVERNRSERTVKNYDFYLRRFLEWSKVSDPAKITLDSYAGKAGSGIKARSPGSRMPKAR